MNKIISLLIIFIIILFTGCSKTPTLSNELETPQHITKTLDTNLEVDADVIATEKSTLPTYTTEIFEPSQEQVQKAFFSEIPTEDLTIKRRTPEDDGEYGFGIYYKREKSFNYFGYQLFMNYKYVNHFDTISCYPDPFYQFPKDFTAAGIEGTQNLSFMSREDALLLLKQSATDLDIILNETPFTCIGLTANDLNTLYKYSGLNYQNDAISFSEGDECYYIVWNTKAETGENIFSENYSDNVYSGMGNSYGNDILGIVGKEGIVTLQTRRVYKILEKKSDEAIIDVNTALETIKKKYNNIILNEPITITKIEFCYSYSLIDKDSLTYAFLPTWSMLSYNTGDDSYSITNVNAITGELF